jgi:hypothetical protein
MLGVEICKMVYHVQKYFVNIIMIIMAPANSISINAEAKYKGKSKTKRTFQRKSTFTVNIQK